MKRHSLTELVHTPKGSLAVKLSRNPKITYSQILKKTKLKKNVLIRLFKLAGTIGRRKGRKLIRTRIINEAPPITAEDIFNYALHSSCHPTTYGAWGPQVIQRDSI